MSTITFHSPADPYHIDDVDGYYYQVVAFCPKLKADLLWLSFHMMTVVWKPSTTKSKHD